MYETDAELVRHRRDLDAGYVLTYDPGFNPAENGLEGEMTIELGYDTDPYEAEMDALEREVRLELAAELHEVALGESASLPAEHLLQAVEEAFDDAKAELEELEAEHPKFSAAIHDYVAVELAKRLDPGADEFHAKLLEIIVIGDIVRDLQAELTVEEGGYDHVAEEMMRFADAMRDKAFIDAELLLVEQENYTLAA